MFLVNETLNFQTYYVQKVCHFLPEQCKSSIFTKRSAKNITAIDFVSTEKLHKS